MTKQEEIREELARRLAIRDDKGFLNHRTHKYIITDEQYEFTDRILRGLHSQGVVIKIDRELPLQVACIKCHKLFDLSNEGLGRAGYVAVEPLIKSHEKVIA